MQAKIAADERSKLQLVKMFVGKSHCEPDKYGLQRINKIAPSAYTVSIDDLKTVHWGYGGERNTEAMLAHGSIRGANISFLQSEAIAIDLITPNPGTERYFAEFVPKRLRDLADGAFKLLPDSFENWEKAHELLQLGWIKFRTPTIEEQEYTKQIQMSAHVVALAALEHFRRDRLKFAFPGVLVTDEDPGAPRLDLRCV